MLKSPKRFVNALLTSFDLLPSSSCVQISGWTVVQVCYLQSMTFLHFHGESKHEDVQQEVVQSAVGSSLSDKVNKL